MGKYLLLGLLINLTSQAQQWQWGIEGQNILNPKMAIYNNAIFLSGTFHHSAQIKNVSLTASDSVSGFLCKIDPFGSVIWTVVFESQSMEIADVKANASGIYLGGSFKGTLTGNSISLLSQGDQDIFMLKFDQQGTIQWGKSDGSPNTEHLMSFDLDSTLIVSGQFSKGAKLDNQQLTSQCPGELNVFIAKYNLNGANIWVKEIAGDSATGAYVTQIFYDTHDHPIFLGGGFNTMNYAGTDTGFCSICQPLLRFSQAGSLDGLLIYSQDGSGNYPNVEVLLDDHDNIYNLLPTGCNICHLGIELDKYDKNGTSLFQKQITNGISYFTPGESYAQRLAVGHDQIYIGGKYKDTIAFAGNDTVTGIGLFISALDTAGNVNTVNTIPLGNFDSSKEIREMLCDNNDVYVMGIINSQATFGNWVLNSGNFSNTFFLSKLGGAPASVKTNKLNKDYFLFPNPSKGKIFVGDKAIINVWNVFSQRVEFEQSGPEIDLSTAPKGIYFVEMMAGDNRMIKKVILE